MPAHNPVRNEQSYGITSGSFSDWKHREERKAMNVMQFFEKVRHVLDVQASKRKINKLYDGKDYLDGYVAHTNQRVALNPKEAIGGMWDEMGTHQFNFLQRMGLSTEDRLLDLGCGTLRAGRHFIKYLEPSNYTGIDISPACLQAASDLVKEEKLESKRPRLILNTSKTLKFDEVADETFDYILAQSVFTHLPDELIREFFENVGKLMGQNSVFFFTYNLAESSGRTGIKDFAYPWAFFEKLATDNEFVSEEISESYEHPRGQNMGVIRKSRSS